jgi:hypothetical protein
VNIEHPISPSDILGRHLVVAVVIVIGCTLLSITITTIVALRSTDNDAIHTASDVSGTLVVQ